MDPSRRVTVLALVAVAMVTWRELKAGEIPPAPHVYVGTAIVYGIAHVIAEASPKIGVYLAFAWTLFIAYTVVGDRATRIRRVTTNVAKAPAKAPGRSALRTARPTTVGRLASRPAKRRHQKRRLA